MAVRNDQLERLGIPLPPASAWDVELSPRDVQLLNLWLLSQIKVQNIVKSQTFTTKNVTTAATEILPKAGTAKRSVAIQNNSATATVWIAIDSVPAIDTLGIRIGPSGYWESQWDFNGSLKAIASANCSVTLIVGNR